MKRFSSKCKIFVDKYANQVVELIFKGLKPKVICSMILICSKSNTELMMNGFDVTSDVESEVENKPQCVLCEFVMDKLEEELKDKKTDEEIKHAIRTVCQKMPKSVAHVCSQFVDEYFMMIVAIITTTNPKDMCSSLKLCDSFEDIVFMDVAKDELIKCSLCRGILTSLDSIVENPFFDKSLEKMEETACKKFTAIKYVKQCVDMVKLHGPEILDLLKNFTDTDEVCYKIKVCSFAKLGLVQMS